MQMIADKIVLDNVIDSISDETVRRVLKKTKLKPYLNEEWCIPKEQDAAFVDAMEDVLDVYRLPYDSNCPIIGMDDKPYQLLGQVREPIPMKSG